MASPRAPSGLGRPGRALWRSIAGPYELKPDELRMLEDACRTADLVARLEDAAAQDGPIAAGSMGQPVINPALPELRQQRALLARLLADLALPFPDEDQDQGADPGRTVVLRQARSALARKAARARWA